MYRFSFLGNLVVKEIVWRPERKKGSLLFIIFVFKEFGSEYVCRIKDESKSKKLEMRATEARVLESQVPEHRSASRRKSRPLSS